MNNAVTSLVGGQAHLKAHILSLSKSQHYPTAIREWRLVDVEISEEFGECPCGQAIKEHCHLENTITGEKTHVGNVCVKRFMDMDTGTLFDGLRRIAKDPSKAKPNTAVIHYANERGHLFDKELGFLLDVKNKRNFSEPQRAWIEKINRRILKGVIVNRVTSK